jgi:hypothetical protein
MRKGLRTSVALLLLVLGGAGGVSHARSVSAILGRAASGAQLSCFGVDFNTGRVTQTCAGTADFEIGLPLDSNGGHSGSFTINVPNLTASQCRVVGIGRDGTGFSQSGFKMATTINTFETVAWSGVNVPANGLMYVDCFLAQNAMISKNDHTPN